MGGPGHGGPGGALSMPVEKAKDFKGTLKRLVGYLMPEKRRFLIVGFLAVGSTVFTIVGPKVMGKATTKIGEGILAKYVRYQEILSAVQSGESQSTINQLFTDPVARIDFFLYWTYPAPNDRSLYHQRCIQLYDGLYHGRRITTYRLYYA